MNKTVVYNGRWKTFCEHETNEVWVERNLVLETTDCWIFMQSKSMLTISIRRFVNFISWSVMLMIVRNLNTSRFEGSSFTYNIKHSKINLKSKSWFLLLQQRLLLKNINSCKSNYLHESGNLIRVNNSTKHWNSRFDLLVSHKASLCYG